MDGYQCKEKCIFLKEDITVHFSPIFRKEKCKALSYQHTMFTLEEKNIGHERKDVG